MCHLIVETGIQPSELLQLDPVILDTMIAYVAWRNKQKPKRR